MPSTTSSVAAAVRAELARAGISGRQFARDLGVSAGWMERRLRGDIALRIDDLVTIAQRLDIPLSRLTEPPERAAS